MGYGSGKAKNHNFHAMQYKFNCQNNRTTPNSLITHKENKNNARMGYRILNLKNKDFKSFYLQKLVVRL